MQGFAPADETLLFRQKCPKPFLPVRGPPGQWHSVKNLGAFGEGAGGIRVRVPQTVAIEGVGFLGWLCVLGGRHLDAGFLEIRREERPRLTLSS